jgi:hypothetical protein
MTTDTRTNRDEQAPLCKRLAGRAAGFTSGFVGGGLAAMTYLLLGGSYFGTVPKWASIIFYPGFLAGFNFYEHVTHSILSAQVVGCVAVGLSYGILTLAYCSALVGGTADNQHLIGRL